MTPTPSLTDLPLLGNVETVRRLLGEGVTVAEARRICALAGQRHRKRIKVRQLFQMLEDFPEILDGQSPEHIATSPLAVNGSKRYAS